MHKKIKYVPISSQYKPLDKWYVTGSERQLEKKGCGIVDEKCMS